MKGHRGLVLIIIDDPIGRRELVRHAMERIARAAELPATILLGRSLAPPEPIELLPLVEPLPMPRLPLKLEKAPRAAYREYLEQLPGNRCRRTR